MTENHLEEKRPTEKHTGSKDVRRNQTLAEWLIFGLSLLVTLGLVGFISYEHFIVESRPPVIEIKPALNRIRQVNGSYYLPVDVANKGTRLAQTVEIKVSLETDSGNPEESKVSLDYLPGDSTQQRMTVWEADPRSGKLSYEIGFEAP